MNFDGKFGLHTGSGLSAHGHTDSLSKGADSFIVPDAHLLFSGDYARSGADLIISDHLHRVVVSNYFHGDKRPALVSPEGAPLDPKVVDALTGHVQYAQAGTAAAAKVVGHVVKMTGSASIVRNGVTIDVNNGDNVYQNDVVQTGSGSTLGLVMIDGTTFNLTANARLMMNDLTYDATSTSNTSLFTLVQGAATFVAGQVAKTGDMKVSTPVATMGIRGTAVILDINAIDGTVSVSVVNQRDGQVHAVQVFNARGDLIGTVTSNGTSLTLRPTATFEVIAQESNKTVAQVLTEFNAFQQLLSTYDIGKQLVPNTPAPTDGRRGDSNQQSLTKFAGSTISPIDSTTTRFNTDIASTKDIKGGAGTDEAGTLKPTGEGAGVVTKVAVTIGDGPVQFVEVAATSIPFVVTPSPVSRISSGPGDHFGPVMSADGQFVTYDPDGAIYLFDRKTGATKTIATPGEGLTYGSPTISSDGHFVVYQGSDGTQSRIFIYNNDASDPAHYGQITRLMSGGQAAVSGDGSKIVVERGGSIGLYDQQGHELASITGAALGITGTLWKPAISADGHIIAFWSSDLSSAGGAGQLFTYDLSTATVRSIAGTATDAGNSAASFSADGHYVVYQSDAPGGHSEIYLYDLRTGQVVFHTANPDPSYNPVLSPDGHFIILASDARLTADDKNAVADIYVIDVTDPSHPAYKLVSVLDDGTQGDDASNLGAAISAGGQFIAFGSRASNFSSGDGPGTGDIFVVDPTSGHSAIILEGRNSPAVLTASGVIKLTGEHSGITLGVSDSRLTASFDSHGDIQWSFSEPRSDFASLQPGEISVQRFVITLSTDRSTTEIPVKVSIYDVDQPVVSVADAAPVASPVALAAGMEDTSYTISAAALLAGVVDIDGPSLSITAVGILSGGGGIVDNHDGTFTYTPAPNSNGPVVFSYTASDGTLSASSIATLNVGAVNDAPVVTKAAFAVSEGGTVVLSVANIGVADPDSASFTVAVSNVTHGKFQTTADGSSWADATTFTTADLTAGHVRFVHDGGENAPTFSIQADDGAASNHASATVAGTVDFTNVNDAPTITSAALSILEGGTVVLGAASIGVTDPDSTSFTFAVSNVTHGAFQTTADGIHWTNATAFTTADLNAGHVRFVHDGGELAPTFSIQANDGAASNNQSNVLAGSVSFTHVNDAPVVTTAALTVPEGGTVVLGASNVAVTDPDNNSFVFTTSNVSHGTFEITANGSTWVPVTTFTSADLNAGHVRFVHDGSEDAPTFSLQANDGTGSNSLSNVLAGTVTFTNVNDAPVAVADTGVSITQNGGVPVSFSPILNASATGAGSEYVITQAINTQVGALWSDSKISLNTSFTISAELFFGADDGGADGFSFIIQNQSKTTIGASGGGLGYQGIGHSVAIEFDTWDNGPTFNDIQNDHAAFDINGSMSGIGGPIDLGNIEDGQYHPVTIDWNAATHVITLSYNGVVIGTQTIDVAATVGSDEAYIGFAGSTGAANNLQKIRNLSYQSADNSVVLDVLGNDTDVDPGDKATLHVVSATSARGASLAFSGLAGAGIVYSPGDVFKSLAAGATATDTVTYTISDNHGAQSTSTAQVTIVGLNDAPVFSGAAAGTPFAVNGSPVAVATNVTASDIDSNSYNGGSLTATVTQGSEQGDTLSIANSQYIRLDGPSVQFDADGDGSFEHFVTIGTLTSNFNTLTVTLNGSASDAAVEALTQAIRFGNDLPNAVAGTRTVTFTLNDGGGTANGGHDSTFFTATIDVTADLPPNTLDVTVSGIEDVSKPFSLASSGPDARGFVFDTVPNASIGAIQYTDAFGQSGKAVAGIEYAAGTTFAFIPAHDWNGTEVVHYHAVGTGGVADPTPNDLTFQFAAVNDAPEIAEQNDPVTANVQEDVTTSVSGQLASSDVDGGAPVWSVVGGSAPHPADYAVTALEFKLTGSGGTPSFDDSGAHTPDASNYTLLGSFGTVAGGVLLDDEHATPFLTGLGAEPFVGQFATRTEDLRKADAFTLEARFALTIPDDLREAYGIRLVDGASNNDTIELAVRRGENGSARVQLRDIDFSTDTDTTLDTFGLSTPAAGDNPQIVLRAVHAAGAAALTFFFDIIHSNGAATETHQLVIPGGLAPGIGTLFNGESATRAQLFAYAPQTADSFLNGQYGALSIDATGAWTYSLRNGTNAVQALKENQAVPENFTVQVDDGHGGTATRDIDVTVHGTNDAPVVNARGATLAYTENQAAAAIDPILTLADVDSTMLTGAKVQIGTGFVSGQDVLGFATQHGITGNYVASTGILTLTGPASVANYQTALRSVTYFNNSDNPSGAARTISFQVDDGAVHNHASNVATAQVNVTPVNDAPDFTGAAAPAYVINGSPVAIVTNIAASDIDSDDFNGGALNVQVTGGSHDGDHLFVGNTNFISISGGSVYYDADGSAGSGGPHLIGQVAAESTDTRLIIELSDGSTDAAAMALAQAIRFENTSIDPTTDTRTITLTLGDGGGIANGGDNATSFDVSLAVAAPDQAPVITAQAAGNHVLSSSGGDVPGRVAYQGVEASGLGISGDSKVTVEFWLKDSTEPTSMAVGFYEYDLLIGNNNDGTSYIGFNTGQADLAYVQRSDLQNQWHHITAVFVTGNAQASKLYIDGVLQTLQPSFPNNAFAVPGDTLHIGGWGVHAQYALAGQIDDVSVWHGERIQSEITADMQGSVTGPQPGLVASYSFENVSNGTGGVIDNSGNGHNGTLSTLTTANVIADSTVRAHINEDHVLVFSNANHNGISVGDSDSDHLTVTLTVSHGSLTVTTSGLTVSYDNDTTTLSGPAANINAALEGLSYQPDLNYNGADALVVTVSDGTLSDTKTIDIAINPANDAPVAVGDGVTIASSYSSFLTNTTYNDFDPDHGAFTISGAAHDGTQASFDDSGNVYKVQGSYGTLLLYPIGNQAVTAGGFVNVHVNPGDYIFVIGKDIHGDALDTVSSIEDLQPGQSLVDEFTYTIADSNNAQSAPATITITLDPGIVSATVQTADGYDTTALWADLHNGTLSVVDEHGADVVTADSLRTIHIDAKNLASHTDEMSGTTVLTGGLIKGFHVSDSSGALFDETGFNISAASFESAIDASDASLFSSILRTYAYNINGGPAADVLRGGDLADRIDGGGGADVIEAGGGNDLIVVGSNAAWNIDGGSGIDTLQVNENTANIWLQGPSRQAHNIEIFDLNKTTAATFFIDPPDAATLNVDHVARILGNSDDTVDLGNDFPAPGVPGGHWVKTPDAMYPDSDLMFDKYEYQDRGGSVQETLYIEQGVVVNHQPVANPDNLIVSSDAFEAPGGTFDRPTTSLAIDNGVLLANDYDEDVGQTSFVSGYSSQPTNGTLDFTSHLGTTFYDLNVGVSLPGTAQSLSDAFSYVAHDGEMSSNAAQVNLKVIGPNPDASHTLQGTGGDDIFLGGQGHDTFVFSPGMGQDTIVNFDNFYHSSAQDRIQLDNFTSVPTGPGGTFTEDELTAWKVTAFQATGNDVLIHLDGSDTLLLTNTTIAHLHASDFIVHPLLVA